MAEAFCEGPGALAGNFHKAGVGRDLVEDRQQPGRLRQDALVKIGFELNQCVIDSQTVVFDAALEKVGEFLLPGNTFANLHKLIGGSIDRVVELGFDGFGAVGPGKGLLAEVGDFAVDIQIESLEVIEFTDELEDFGMKEFADFKRSGARLLLQLPDVISWFTSSGRNVISINSGTLDLKMRR